MKEFICNAQRKLGFKLNVKNPHKLCDFKPAYGFLFEEYIKDYNFWGYCDLDIILGNLNNFITNKMLDKYDKIFCLGHMTLYKNNLENNRAFMYFLDGEKIYKEVFKNERTLVFDEAYGGKRNINTIFEQNGKEIYTDDLSFNVNIFPTKFTRTRLNYKKYIFEVEKKRTAIYIWNNGDFYRLFLEKGKLVREDFIYLHLQQRKMKINNNIFAYEYFKILPNKFDVLEDIDINEKNFKKIKKHTVCFHYFSKHLEWKISKWRR